MRPHRVADPRRAPVAALPILGPFLLLVLGGCAADGDSSPSERGKGGAATATAVVRRGDFEQVLLLSGELEAARSIQIKAPQTAIFQMRIQYLAEEGSTVRAGDPLLDFDNSSRAAQVLDLETRILDAKTQVETKRSELMSALKDLEITLAEKRHAHAVAKLEAAVDPEVLSRKVHAERQLALEKAARELDEIAVRVRLTGERGKADLDVLAINVSKLEQDLLAAHRDIELLSIRAPIDGIVVHERRQDTNLRYQEGDSCWPGQGILRLPDLSEMQVVLHVSEVDGPLLSAGMPLTLTLDAFPGREVRGEIRQVPAMAARRSDDSTVSVFKVVASLEETWADEMKPGMSVLGRVVVSRLEDVPLVSRAAVSCGDLGCAARLEPGPDGRPRTVPVTPIARDAASYVLSPEDAARIDEANGGLT